jgi:hypothetical protein
VDTVYGFILISVQCGLGRDRERYDCQIKMAVIALVQASSPLLLLRYVGFEGKEGSADMRGREFVPRKWKMREFSYFQ